MHPILFHLGSFTFPTYGLMVASGYLAAILYIFSKARSAGFKKEDLSDLVFYTVISGIVGAKFFYAATYWSEFGPDTLSRLVYVARSFQYGFVFYGGLIFGAAAFFYVGRRKRMDPLRTSDLFAPALSLGHAFGRIGCFMAGCCYGSPTTGPLSVIFTDPNSEVNPAFLGRPLYPVQLYESAGNFVIFLILNYALKRSLAGKLPRGFSIALYAALYSLLRFSDEFLRGDDRGAFHFGLSPAQLISAAVFAIAGTALVLMKVRHEKN